ncbi:blood vessel epicardial substance-like [Stegodyphus dumicola]|uniref:blood vessel epicardial substance-like n=1 Tax=Stegodyphus dumicola TaxID=202533 RepID=UPI0015B1EFA3|nr:blood vessel epicardial substance-like [Stegodyphus dumicola]
MKVTCEDVLLHYLSPTEFVDSPEWESCATNSDKHFQVTLTATEPCQLLCWGRKELLTILANNQFLDVVMYNLIGKDITHKLYSLNEQHRKGALPDKLSLSDSLEFWRNPLLRSHSVDMVHTGKKGHVRSLFWKKPETQDRRTSTAFAEHLGTSRSSNYSDPGPDRNKRNAKTSTKDSENETPV